VFEAKSPIDQQALHGRYHVVGEIQAEQRVLQVVGAIQSENVVVVLFAT